MISYNNLWHIMLDKNIKKGQLCELTGISSSTMAKLSKNEMVSLDVLEKICIALDCNLGDVAEFDYGQGERQNEEV